MTRGLVRVRSNKPTPPFFFCSLVKRVRRDISSPLCRWPVSLGRRYRRCRRCSDAVLGCDFLSRLRFGRRGCWREPEATLIVVWVFLSPTAVLSRRKMIYVGLATSVLCLRVVGKRTTETTRTRVPFICAQFASAGPFGCLDYPFYSRGVSRLSSRVCCFAGSKGVCTFCRQNIFSEVCRFEKV